MEDRITIGTRSVGRGCPVFVVAEAGINHNGDLETAMELVRSAAVAGADCVKFQTFRAECVVTRGAPKAVYQVETTGRSGSQLEMLRQCELEPDAFRGLKAYAEELGMVFLSTPYNFEDIELLEDIGVAAYKVASGQIVEHPFLRKIARTGKPVILSTGMATLAEVDAALRVMVDEGGGGVVLMQCTTDYPSRMEDANLKVIRTFMETFGCPVGYSDHTIGMEAAVAAVALGASAVEKHFTLDRALPGPDHSSSVVPAELEMFVQCIRRTERALGNGRKEPSGAERANAAAMRRSITAARDIRRGEVITEGHLIFKRPATGLSPAFYDAVVGKRAARDIHADDVFEMDMIEW